MIHRPVFVIAVSKNLNVRRHLQLNNNKFVDVSIKYRKYTNTDKIN